MPSWFIVDGEGPTRSLETDSDSSSGGEESDEDEVVDEGSILVSNSPGSSTAAAMDGYGTVRRDAQGARVAVSG